MFRFVVCLAVVFVLTGSARGQITAADADFDGNGVVDFADFLLFVSVFGQTVDSGAVDSVERDRAALKALYHATRGHNWKKNTNWLSDTPLEQWHGIYTNEHGRVITLDLNHNDLSGIIPPEIGNLANLRSLSLSNNDLFGTIPPEIGNLSNLGALDLSNNHLGGSIPPEWGNLSNIGVLYLSFNVLSGPIPSEWGNLSNLQVLDLSNNHSLCMPSALKDWKFYDTYGVSKCSE